jgi:hypothetical protein
MRAQWCQLVGFVVAGKGDGSCVVVCKEASNLSIFFMKFFKDN